MRLSGLRQPESTKDISANFVHVVRREKAVRPAREQRGQDHTVRPHPGSLRKEAHRDVRGEQGREELSLGSPQRVRQDERDRLGSREGPAEGDEPREGVEKPVPEVVAEHVEDRRDGTVNPDRPKRTQPLVHRGVRKAVSEHGFLDDGSAHCENKPRPDVNDARRDVANENVRPVERLLPVELAHARNDSSLRGERNRSSRDQNVQILDAAAEQIASVRDLDDAKMPETTLSSTGAARSGAA